jgi:hypothetical protein
MSGGDTLLGLRTRVRQYVHEKNPNTSWWEDDFIDNVINSSYRKRCTQLVSAHEGYFTLEMKTPVINEESYYQWPEGFERLIKLEIEDVEAEIKVPLTRWERHRNATTLTTQGSVGYLPTYRPVGSGFLIEPALSAGGTSLAKLIEGYDSAASTYTTGADCVLSQMTSNTKHNDACIQIDKTGGSEVNPAVYVQCTGAYDLTEHQSICFWAYIPTLAWVAQLRTVFLRIYTGADYSEYWVNEEDVVAGWNYIEIDLSSATTTSGAGVTLAEVDTIRVGFEVGAAQSIALYGFLIDYLHQPAENDADYNLVLEYTGLPARLVDDADVFHDDFPVTMEELIVLDTAVVLMASEAALESGQIRSLLREKLEWEATFLRYVDSRMVSTEQVDPFIPHYMDA